MHALHCPLIIFEFDSILHIGNFEHRLIIGVLRGRKTCFIVGTHGPSYVTAANIKISTVVQRIVMGASKLRAATARGFDIVYMPERDLLRSPLKALCFTKTLFKK